MKQRSLCRFSDEMPDDGVCGKFGGWPFELTPPLIKAAYWNPVIPLGCLELQGVLLLRVRKEDSRRTEVQVD